jgi:hypothetical protein
MSLPKICTCPTVPAADCPFHHQAACSSLAAMPCYRLLGSEDVIQGNDEFLEDDAAHWSRIDWNHSWNIGHRWHSGLKPMRRILRDNATAQPRRD